MSNGRWAVALTVADNGYMGLDSISFIDLENLWQNTLSPISALPMGRRRMPESSVRGDVEVKGRSYSISFRHVPGRASAQFRYVRLLGQPAHTG